MLSIPCEARYGAVAMTPQKFKDETLRALVDTVEAIARQQPTVMLFEDAHWADPTTLETMDLLIHRVRNIPLLVVITHRPEFPSRWSHHGHVAALSLTQAHPRAERAMVSRLAGGKALPADLLEQILAQDRRRAAVRRGADQVDPGICGTQGCGRPMGIRRPCGHARDTAHLARFADGAAGSFRSSEGDRADRCGDRARVQL